MKINGRDINGMSPPYIVAELSANHLGSKGRLMLLADLAAQSGADAVKVQIYDPRRLAEQRGGASKVVDSGPWAGRTLIDLYVEGHTPLDWVPDLAAHCARAGIDWFASVFHDDIVTYLDQCGTAAFKISSFEVGCAGLIAAAAATGKPLIMSTGMASGNTISEAIKAATGAEFALLHCVSQYPCPIDKANLQRIELMRRVYGCPVGFSDHTLGADAAIAATALGAVIIEKHFTVSRSHGGLDASFSAEPEEFRAMVASCRNAWAACQDVTPEEPYKSLRSVA